MWWHGGAGLIERSERGSLSAVATHDVFCPIFMFVGESVQDLECGSKCLANHLFRVAVARFKRSASQLEARAKASLADRDHIQWHFILNTSGDDLAVFVDQLYQHMSRTESRQSNAVFILSDGHKISDRTVFIRRVGSGYIRGPRFPEIRREIPLLPRIFTGSGASIRADSGAGRGAT